MAKGSASIKNKTSHFILSYPNDPFMGSGEYSRIAALDLLKSSGSMVYDNRLCVDHLACKGDNLGDTEKTAKPSGFIYRDYNFTILTRGISK